MDTSDKIISEKAKQRYDLAVGEGAIVQVHYVGTLEDGVIFDSSMDRAPLELTIGQGSTIPGFINGIMGMRLGCAVGG